MLCDVCINWKIILFEPNLLKTFSYVFTPNKRWYFFGKNTVFDQKSDHQNTDIRGSIRVKLFRFWPETAKCSFCEGDLRVFGVHMPFAKISKIYGIGRTDGRTDERTQRKTRTDGRTFPIYGDRDVISASRNYWQRVLRANKKSESWNTSLTLDSSPGTPTPPTMIVSLLQNPCFWRMTGTKVDTNDFLDITNSTTVDAKFQIF